MSDGVVACVCVYVYVYINICMWSLFDLSLGVGWSGCLRVCMCVCMFA